MLEVAAEDGVSVILSSHIVAELERVCDYLITLTEGRPQLAGPIREIVASHRLLIGPRSDTSSVGRVHNVIRESHIGRQTTLLVRANGHVYDSVWEQHEVDLEEIVLAYLGYTPGSNGSAAPHGRRFGHDLGRLAPATHRDADRARHPRPARGAARPDRSLMANAYHPDGLASCLAPTLARICGNAIGAFQMRFQSLWDILATSSRSSPA